MTLNTRNAPFPWFCPRTRVPSFPSFFFLQGTPKKGTIIVLTCEYIWWNGEHILIAQYTNKVSAIVHIHEACMYINSVNSKHAHSPLFQCIRQAVFSHGGVLDIKVQSSFVIVLFTYIWTIILDVSIQWHHWLPLSVHLKAYCILRVILSKAGWQRSSC